MKTFNSSRRVFSYHKEKVAPSSSESLVSSYIHPVIWQQEQALFQNITLPKNHKYLEEVIQNDCWIIREESRSLEDSRPLLVKLYCCHLVNSVWTCKSKCQSLVMLSSYIHPVIWQQEQALFQNNIHWQKTTNILKKWYRWLLGYQRRVQESWRQ